MKIKTASVISSESSSLNQGKSLKMNDSASQNHGSSRTSSVKINEHSQDSDLPKVGKKRFKKIEPGDENYLDHANDKIKKWQEQLKDKNLSTHEKKML